MADAAVEMEADLRAGGELDAGEIQGGHDDHHVPPSGVGVEMDLAAHHLADVHLGGQGALAAAQGDVAGPHAQGDGLRADVLRRQGLLLGLGQGDLDAAHGDAVGPAFLEELRVEEVHLRHADEPGDEQVRGMVEDLLRGADLLDEAVPHDDDPVAQGHGLRLVMGDVHEGRVDLLAELDDLRAHLVAELGVQVGQGLVHQQHLGLPDDGPADGHALALAAGEGLGLAVQVLGDVQDLGGFLDPLVDLGFVHLAQLQGEGHVLIDRHMGIQGVALEDHGDVAVLGLHVVHQLAVDVQLALADLLQAGDHPQGGGLAAAGGADQDDELLIGDVQIELLDRHDAFVRHLEVDLLLGRVLLLGLLLAAAVGIDLLDALEVQSCHSVSL